MDEGLWITSLIQNLNFKLWSTVSIKSLTVTRDWLAKIQSHSVSMPGNWKTICCHFYLNYVICQNIIFCLLFSILQGVSGTQGSPGMPGPKGAKVRNTHFQHFDVICSFIITLKVCHEPFFFFVQGSTGRVGRRGSRGGRGDKVWKFWYDESNDTIIIYCKL